MLTPLSKPLQCPSITTLETLTTTIATGYGLWLGIGQPFASQSLFRYAGVLDEWLWCAALLFGVALYSSGVALWRCWVRQLGLALIGVVWLGMALCIALADLRLPGIWMLLVLGGYALYAAARLVR